MRTAGTATDTDGAWPIRATMRTTRTTRTTSTRRAWPTSTRRARAGRSRRRRPAGITPVVGATAEGRRSWWSVKTA
eukprot:4435829-Prymnesium_polylepis.1